MHFQQYTAASILASILLAGCASHATSALSSNTELNPVLPKIIQTGQPPTNWVTLNLPNAFGLISGPDKAMYVPDGNMIDRIDVATGTITSYPNPLQGFTRLASGPDENVWMCSSGTKIASMTPLGVTTIFDLGQQYQCNDFIAGPDGNLWMDDNASSRIGRISRSGIATWYSITTGERPEGLTVGLDGFIYILENKHNDRSAIARIDTSMANYKEFRTARSLDGITTASNGSIYAGWDRSLRILSATGHLSSVNLGTPCGDELARTPPSLTIYIKTCASDGSAAFATYGVNSHILAINSLPPPQAFGLLADLAFGPDGNVWMSESDIQIYVNRILSVSPTSATILVGQLQPIVASETGCKHCPLKAVSSNPSVATVAMVGAGQFEVDGQSAGSTTITVSDPKLNTFNVSITVQ